MFIEKLTGLRKKIAKLILFYYYFATRKIFKHATAITSITSKFLDYVEKYYDKSSSKYNRVFPLVSDLKLDDNNQNDDENWWKLLGVCNDQNFRVIYVGSLNSNVDLAPIKKAAQLFKEKQLKVQFVIGGDGDNFQKFKEMMKNLDNVVFAGSVDKFKVQILANKSNVWLIPYFNRLDFKLSIPNKVYDALFFGIPVFTSLEGEVKNLVVNNKIGMFYDKVNSLENCILYLKEKQSLQKSMSENAKKLYNENYEFDKVYDSLISHLENIVRNKT